MYGRAYFGGRYFGDAYFGDGGSAAPPGASAAQIWAYVLPNGLSAGLALSQAHAWLEELHLIHGLRLNSPLSVLATSRSAGTVEQTITEAGGVVTVARDA